MDITLRAVTSADNTTLTVSLALYQLFTKPSYLEALMYGQRVSTPKRLDESAYSDVIQDTLVNTGSQGLVTSHHDRSRRPSLGGLILYS